MVWKIFTIRQLRGLISAGLSKMKRLWEDSSKNILGYLHQKCVFLGTYQELTLIQILR